MSVFNFAEWLLSAFLSAISLAEDRIILHTTGSGVLHNCTGLVHDSYMDSQLENWIVMACLSSTLRYVPFHLMDENS